MRTEGRSLLSDVLIDEMAVSTRIAVIAILACCWIWRAY